MAVVQIEAVHLVTAEGKAAIVTGIDMTSGDPFRGTIEIEPGEHRDARWRSNGFARDAHPGMNLGLEQFEFGDLRETATALGAKF